MLYYPDSYGNFLGQVPDYINEVYVLVLNPMRGNTENQSPVMASDNKEELKRFWDAEKVDPYSTKGDCAFGLYAPGEKTYRKSYREGGPLEWFNPPMSDGDLDHWGNGIVTLRKVPSWKVMGR